MQAIRDAVREELIGTIADGAYGHRNLPPLARLALVGWLNSVEGVTLDWLGHQEPKRDTVGAAAGTDAETQARRDRGVGAGVPRTPGGAHRGLISAVDLGSRDGTAPIGHTQAATAAGQHPSVIREGRLGW
ncbi:hypothetical protein NLX86_02175 [Streptomyces sp. A3M-1-3]|uniref:hypothetical protein n=1 Tax=Streptomyces sp. A3M-1-3 TaxID=2962044 RepID=UPI0020B837A0|nr:hypothetical protein [Streptomyces sp. A3M-1-3]MCP3816988.1 hypothetical protein [Streptomyces sp. A3M-1-3]